MCLPACACLTRPTSCGPHRSTDRRWRSLAEDRLPPRAPAPSPLRACSALPASCRRIALRSAFRALVSRTWALTMRTKRRPPPARPAALSGPCLPQLSTLCVDVRSPLSLHRHCASAGRRPGLGSARPVCEGCGPLLRVLSNTLSALCRAELARCAALRKAPCRPPALYPPAAPPLCSPMSIAPPSHVHPSPSVPCVCASCMLESSRRQAPRRPPAPWCLAHCTLLCSCLPSTYENPLPRCTPPHLSRYCLLFFVGRAAAFVSRPPAPPPPFVHPQLTQLDPIR